MRDVLCDGRLDTLADNFEHSSVLERNLTILSTNASARARLRTHQAGIVIISLGAAEAPVVAHCLEHGAARASLTAFVLVRHDLMRWALSNYGHKARNRTHPAHEQFLPIARTIEPRKRAYDLPALRVSAARSLNMWKRVHAPIAATLARASPNCSAVHFVSYEAFLQARSSTLQRMSATAGVHRRTLAPSERFWVPPAAWRRVHGADIATFVANANEVEHAFTTERALASGPARFERALRRHAAWRESGCATSPAVAEELAAL